MARSRCSAGNLIAFYPDRQFYHPHHEAYLYVLWFPNGSSFNLKYGASLDARINKKCVNPREQDVYYFDNVLTGTLLNLVIVGLVRDGDLARGCQKNPVKFQKF